MYIYENPSLCVLWVYVCAFWMTVYVCVCVRLGERVCVFHITVTAIDVTSLALYQCRFSSLAIHVIKI